MLEIKNLSFAYGKKIIFANISLRFDEGHVTGIVGKNGAGKTTLFRIMTRIYAMQSGEITLGGKKLKPSEVSFMQTEPFFYSYMKGHEYLEIVASTLEEVEDSRRYASFLDLPLDELIDNYSTGMRKKLAFSALFALNKPVIILDEPYNGVDLEGNEIIKHIIKSNKRGKTVILSSHILSTLTDICDCVYHIDKISQMNLYPKNEFEQLERKLDLVMINKIRDLEYD